MLNRGFSLKVQSEDTVFATSSPFLQIRDIQEHIWIEMNYQEFAKGCNISIFWSGAYM